ncbi:MAG: hypothetical protein AAGL89_16385 [Pseudomonadota bacterium]
MTPNFALSLSFDGLRLMHRVAGGWHVVGDVALDVEDLTAALAELHAKAQVLEPGGISTKLLIPNDQIKYLALDTTRAEEDDVRAALDGATPYALDDLVYDFAKGGGRTYVAAVARETLNEAQGFAAEHNFNPVCFAAVPEPFTYVGEAFFGTVDGQPAERDAEPVVIIGTADVDLPSAAPSTPALSEPASDPASIEPSDADGEAETPDQEPEVDVAEAEDTAEGDTQHDHNKTAADTERADAFDEDPADGPVPPSPVDEPTDDKTASEELLDDAPPPAPPAFASLRADRSAGRPTGAVSSGDKAEPTLTRPSPPPTLAVPTDAEGTGTAPTLTADRSDGAEAGSPATELNADVPEPTVAPPITGEASGTVSAEDAAATLTAGPAVNEAPQKPVDGITPSAAKAIGAVGGMFASRRKLRAERAAEDAATASADADHSTPKHTVFGARKPPKKKEKVIVGGKPRFLGLILTVILLLILLAVAAFAAINDERVARWFGLGSEDAPQVAATDTAPTAPTIPEDTTSEPVPDTPVAAIAEPDGETPTEPEVADDLAGNDAPSTQIVPLGQVLSPEDAARIYAATGVWQRAPRLPVTPRTTSLEALDIDVVSRPVTRVPSSPLADASAIAGDAVIATPVNPPPPTAQFDFGEDGLVVATPDGAATPDGILVIAGRPPLEPPTRPGTEAPVITPQDQLAELTPDTAEITEDAPEGVIVISGRPAITPPVRTGTVAPADAPDADALADGADTLVAEEGLIVIAGSPSILPPVRPGTIAPSQAPPVVADEIAPDPEAAEAPETPQLEGLNVIAGSPPILPPVRPGTTAPTSEATDEDASVDALRQDVLAALAQPQPEQNAPTDTPTDATDAEIGSLAQTPTADTPRPLTRPASIEEAAIALSNTPVLGNLTARDAAAFRPQLRPSGLAPEPQSEVAPEQPEITVTETANGLQLAPEIAAAVEAAQNRPDPAATATAQAVALSIRPDSRPRNMDRIVSRAQEAAAAQQQAAAQQVAAVAVAPSGPVSNAVAQNATLEGAINLRDVNLIGIYGSDSDRRALVRLGNGRFVRVTVGDRLDGGRVSGISANALSYTKQGRTITLRVAG